MAKGRTQFAEHDGERIALRTDGTVRDVTARKEAQVALAATLEHLELALDVGGMAIWEWDLRTGKIECRITISGWLVTPQAQDA